MGYDPEFIQGCKVPFPGLGAHVQEAAFNNGVPIDHTRFSIIFSEKRGLAIVTAHNIDGESVIPEGDIKRKDRFRLDPDVPKQLQIDNDRGYLKNPWDRGHLVRRRSMHWGERAVAEEADAESYFWTNIAPQHERLHDTAWGSIEDWMLEFADESDHRASVFTGPVFTPDDPVHENKPDEIPFQVPAGFWKILAVKREGELRAAAFLVWQRDFDRAEPVAFDPILEQVRLTTLEYLTGLGFDSLRDADPLRFGEKSIGMRERGIGAGGARSRPVAIMGAQDIVI